MSTNNNVNRIAQLCNLVSKPELNGVYVSIESYNRAKDRYAIRTLVPPNSTAEVVSILVKLSSLDFTHAANFSSRYPHALAFSGVFQSIGFREGTIFDYSNSKYDESAKAELAKGNIIAYQTSCRVVGAAAASPEELKTVFPGPTGVLFHQPGNDVIVEFENIHFTAQDKQMTLQNAALVKFKNCRFTNGEETVGVIDGSTAVFENCLFDGASIYAIRVEDANSHATILNCTFRNCTPAVHVLEGGTATLNHCTFLNCSMSMWAGPRSPDVQYINCSSTGGSSVQVIFMDSSKGLVKGSYWQGCEWGAVKVQGPKRTTVVIEDCVMDRCTVGVGTTAGKVDLKVINTKIRNTMYYAACISSNTIGSVEFIGCTMSNNRRDVVVTYALQCAVTVDGVKQTPDAFTARQMKEIDSELDELYAQYPVKRGCRTALKVLRACKKTFTGEVRCEKCGILEPLEVKFNVCSKCKNVCYCTRECQVAHWKAVHKEECGKIAYG